MIIYTYLRIPNRGGTEKPLMGQSTPPMSPRTDSKQAALSYADVRNSDDVV